MDYSPGMMVFVCRVWLGQGIPVRPIWLVGWRPAVSVGLISGGPKFQRPLKGLA